MIEESKSCCNEFAGVGIGLNGCDYFIYGRPYVDKRKKYLHHKETHRRDKNFVSIKGTNEKVYVIR